jgi:hypothetical protein
MSEARIGRILVASLHQAIADLLPTRLEFYENWLNSSGLREGTVGLAAISAVLSFLRTEGEGYALVTTRAGEYASDWTVASVGRFRKRVILALPSLMRARAALRLARQLVRETYPSSRALVRVRRGVAHVDLRGSLFCEVRENTDLPLCGFYAAAVRRMLEAFEVGADARVERCRATGAGGCRVTLALRQV